MKDIDKVIRLVSEWYDVSVKDPNSNIALMITNGGYIHKPTLLKELHKIKHGDEYSQKKCNLAEGSNGKVATPSNALPSDNSNMKICVECGEVDSRDGWCPDCKRCWKCMEHNCIPIKEDK